jgi:hypothetical protein
LEGLEEDFYLWKLQYISYDFYVWCKEEERTGRDEGKKIYLMMLLPIALSMLLALFAHVLLHGRIHKQFFGDGVAR